MILNINKYITQEILFNKSAVLGCCLDYLCFDNN